MPPNPATAELRSHATPARPAELRSAAATPARLLAPADGRDGNHEFPAPPARRRLTTPIGPLIRRLSLVALAVLSACSTVGDAALPTSPTSSEPAAASATFGESAAAPLDNLVDGCVERHADTIDYFPDETTIDVASGLRVTYGSNHKIVEIDGGESADDVVLVLVQCGTPIPAVAGELDRAVVVDVPVGTIGVVGTPFAAGLDAIGRLDALAAIDDAEVDAIPGLAARVDADEVVELGGASAGLDAALADVAPDVVLAAPEVASALDLGAADTLVITTAEAAEPDPLGRAEWIKLLGLLLNEEAAVRDVWEQARSRYEGLADLVAEETTRRPTVVRGGAVGGEWVTADGADSRLVEVAGGVDVLGEGAAGDVAGDDAPPATDEVDAVVAATAGTAVWLDPPPTVGDVASLVALDGRHRDVGGLRNDQVWTAAPRSIGGDDADDGAVGAARRRGVLFPGDLLADVVSILHPGLLGSHELVLYRHLR